MLLRLVFCLGDIRLLDLINAVNHDFLPNYFVIFSIAIVLIRYLTDKQYVLYCAFTSAPSKQYVISSTRGLSLKKRKGLEAFEPLLSYSNLARAPSAKQLTDGRRAQRILLGLKSGFHLDSYLRT